ncbi:universal stress protein [Flavobacteriales bacterium AH-315-E23]|nr:universal stress protein [Flavobacteriales bacterium AH-315-E23]
MSESTNKRMILVPIDFTDITIVALDQAVNLAKVIGAEVTLVNVAEDHGLFNKYISSSESGDYKKETEKKLKNLVSDRSDSGVAMHTMQAHGKIYAKINEIAEMINATLILMGTSGSLGLMKFIGSNTLRVIRESKIPVISIKGKEIAEGLSSILLPLDLTKETKDKVSKAVWLSKLYGNARIDIVSVNSSTDEFIKNKIKATDKQVQQWLQGKGIDTTLKVITDTKGKSVAECIIDYAGTVNAGLIMIMTQQENNVTEMFIGSSAQAIINGSEIPVMSVVPGVHKYGVTL